MFTGPGSNSSIVSTSPPAAETTVPKIASPSSEDTMGVVQVQLRNKPDVKLSSSPPKIAETKPTIATDKPHIPLKPSQIREEGKIYLFKKD